METRQLFPLLTNISKTPKIRISSQTPIMGKPQHTINKLVIYKKTQRLNNQDYIIEISKSISDSNDQLITAYSLFGEEVHYLRIPAMVYGNVEDCTEDIAKRVRLYKGILVLDKMNDSRGKRSRTVIQGHIKAAPRRITIKLSNRNKYNLTSLKQYKD